MNVAMTPHGHEVLAPTLLRSQALSRLPELVTLDDVFAQRTQGVETAMVDALGKG